jgi:hypothetical protein
MDLSIGTFGATDMKMALVSAALESEEARERWREEKFIRQAMRSRGEQDAFCARSRAGATGARLSVTKERAYVVHGTFDERDVESGKARSCFQCAPNSISMRGSNFGPEYRKQRAAGTTGISPPPDPIDAVPVPASRDRVALTRAPRTSAGSRTDGLRFIAVIQVDWADLLGDEDARTSPDWRSVRLRMQRQHSR